MSEETIDVLIIGAGPAGLQAALHAVRKKASVMVLGRPEKSSIYPAHVENYLCVEGVVDGSELLRIALGQVKKFGVELLEEARWQWLDEDIDLASWDAKGQGIAVVSLNVTYRRPAVAHDELEFRCWIEKLGGRSAVCRQEVVRPTTGERLLDAKVTFLLFDLATGRPRPMEGDAREAFTQYIQPEATA